MRGLVHRDFERVRDALTLAVPEGRPGGAAVAVFHRGECVVDLALGTRDELGRPFEPDTLAVSMSTTKGVTATALHRLISLGEVELDAPVARYWPEFAGGGKGAITVRQALAHQAGLYDIASLVPDFQALYDWEGMVHALERATPRHAPGTNYGYHAFTFGWLIGEIVRRVSGTKTFEQALDDVLAGPLGVRGLKIGVDDASMGRVADMVGLRTLPPLPSGAAKGLEASLTTAFRAVGLNADASEAARALFPPGIAGLDLNDRAFRRAALPAANGHFDARSLAQLYSVLAEGGTFRGETFIRPEVIAEASRDHNGYLTVCRVIPFPLRIKLGYHRPISLGLRVPLGGRHVDLGVASPLAFGHFGFGGSGAWADPERRLSVALVTNTFFGKLPIDLRTVAVATAAAMSADARR